MKQFLIPKSGEEYVLAKDFNFLLYPFNLTWYDVHSENNSNHPFKGIYYETLYGNIDKKGNFKCTMNLVHGSSEDVYEHDYGRSSYGAEAKRGMALQKCIVIVDSEQERKSKLIQHYEEMQPGQILGHVSKEITYCIFTDFINNPDNKSYTIPFPIPHVFERMDGGKSFSNIMTKKDLPEIIEYYQKICDNAINSESQKFNTSSSSYKLRIDKKIERYIPFEYTLPAGTKFRFVRFEPKIVGNNKDKLKNFVEIEINDFKVFIHQDDFSGICVE